MIDDKIKQLSDELDKKEDIIGSIIDSSYDGIIILNGTGDVLYAGKAIERITGLLPSKIVGQNVFDLLKKGILHKASVSVKVLRTRKRMSTLLKTRDNKSILSTSTPHLSADGNINYVITNIRNITELDALIYDLQNVGDILDLRKDEKYVDRLINKIKESGVPEFVAKDKKMIPIIELINSMSAFDLNYLITGETGTGKGLLASIIHKLGKRKNRPFVAINCSAIPFHLLESELFGYDKGAFTGALKEGHIGQFQSADKGTVFLDEIGTMPFDTQSKILKFLDEKKIRRLGSSQTIDLDVHIIAATNADLKEEVAKGNFRRDLYYRLKEVSIKIPPLRERPEDIKCLLQYFTEKYCKKYDKKIEFSESATDFLRTYSYPGNVRELKNIVKTKILRATNYLIEVNDLAQDIVEEPQDVGIDLQLLKQKSLKDTLKLYEKLTIIKAYNEYGSTHRAAEALGMKQPTFFRKAKEYGVIDPKPVMNNDPEYKCNTKDSEE